MIRPSKEVKKKINKAVEEVAKKTYTEEEVEDEWNYIAHVFAVDADNIREVKKFLVDRTWEFQHDDFRYHVACYKEMKKHVVA